MDPKISERALKIAAEMQDLEAQVQYCAHANIDWLEVSDDLLMHFSGGKLPEAGYFIYKNVRLCRTGTAEDIAQREKLPMHAILYPHEGYMKVR